MENWIPTRPYHWLMWLGLVLAAAAAALATAELTTDVFGAGLDVAPPALASLAALAWVGLVWAAYSPRAGGSFNILLGLGGAISALVYGQGSMTIVFAAVYAAVLVAAGWCTWVGVSQDPAKGRSIGVGPASQGVVSAQHQAGATGRRQG